MNTTQQAQADSAHRTVCSCGETEHHVIAKRETADGICVCLWSDGMVTGLFGNRLPGVKTRRPRTAKAVSIAREAGRWLLAWCELYDCAELGERYDAYLWAAERGLDISDARKRLARAARVKPTWETTRADRDGRPMTRVWRLPRLRWPGLIVWDEQAPGGGRYHVMSVDRRGACFPTGVRFERIADLVTHLESY